jgi:O-antigen/teichoic acid export membrane protein
MHFPNPTSLKQRVLRAGGWSLAGYSISLGIRFGTNLILTRLLVPEIFGVTAIASMVLVGLTLFSDVGLKPNVIQSRRGNEPIFLNTVWTTQILRGLFIWFFALGISLVIYFARHYDLVPKSIVYENPSLPYVIAVLSFGAVISSFESTKILVASRESLVCSSQSYGASSTLRFGLLLQAQFLLLLLGLPLAISGSRAPVTDGNGSVGPS